MPKVIYSIYKHTTPDGLVYIGATVQKPKARWGVNGSNYKTIPKFYEAIQKYGWDNIQHEVVFRFDNREAACIKEKELIKKYNSTDEKFGYNRGKGSRIPASGSVPLEKMYENMNKDENKFMKKPKLAEKLNISAPMIDKLMREGMPKIKIGKSVRFDYEEVLKWIKERG